MLVGFGVSRHGSDLLLPPAVVDDEGPGYEVQRVVVPSACSVPYLWGQPAWHTASALQQKEEPLVCCLLGNTFSSPPVPLPLATHSAWFVAIWSSPPCCQSRRQTPALCWVVPLISPRSIPLVVFFPFSASCHSDLLARDSFCCFFLVPLSYDSYLTSFLAARQTYWSIPVDQPTLWWTTLQVSKEFSPLSHALFPLLLFLLAFFWAPRGFRLNKPECCCCLPSWRLTLHFLCSFLVAVRSDFSWSLKEM